MLLSCIKSCGGIGWVFGHLIDGTQAEFVRVPYAETSVHKLPDGITNEQAVMLSDILEIGVQYGGTKPGDVVAVIGAGPIGLAVIMTAGLYGASRIISIDLDPTASSRRRNSAPPTASSPVRPTGKERVMALTDGWGVNVAVEAVGLPATFEMATQIVPSGGHVANVGVHGTPVALRLQDLWIHNITITMAW